MGELIVLSDRREERSMLRLQVHRPAFYFDLACPSSYLVAERIERLLGEVEWIPVDGAVLRGRRARADDLAVRAQAEERAAALRLPLIWPEQFPVAVRRALRAAAYASEGGAGARFALAALRLAFCGGYDLEDPEVLIEIAGASGVPRKGCVDAAGDEGRDRELELTARGLRRRGVRSLPVVRLGEHWFEGEPALAGAAALRRDAELSRRAGHVPLAPPA